VTNEKNEQYILDLGTKTVKKVKPGSIDGR